MNRGFDTGRLVGMLMLLGLGSTAAPEVLGKRTPSEANPGDFAVTVGVYDYLGIPAGVLLHAEELTRTVFREAGVELEWINCIIPGHDYLEDPACTQIPRLRNVELRIVGEVKPNLTEGGEDTAGLVMGKMATVFFTRVDNMARLFDLSRVSVLSCVIAHELGHILLPGAGHSRGGIMHTAWSKDELLRLFAHAEAYFTSEQAESLRREVRARKQTKQENDDKDLSTTK